MKRRIIACFLVSLLSACTMMKEKPMMKRPTPNTVVASLTSDSAPLAWVQILPSQRAVAFKSVDFNYVSKLIRFWMLPFGEKFGKVTLVLVDYTILPRKKSKSRPIRVGSVQYCDDFIYQPARYFLNISFYEENLRPPARPSFMGTVTMSVFAAPLYETVHYMVDVLMEEHVYSSVKSRLEIVLDEPNGTLTGFPGSTHRSKAHPLHKHKGKKGGSSKGEAGGAKSSSASGGTQA